MNQVIQTILTRRSIRSYLPKPVSRETIETIIACGNAAPSGVGSRSWRFVVVESAEFRARLAQLARPKYEAWLATMPDAFRSMRAETDKINPDPAYYGAAAIVFVIGWGMTAPLDCPMVCENMMIAARSLDIGSCWVHIGSLVKDEAEVKAALELKDGEKIFGPIILGYPSQDFPIHTEIKPPVVKFV